MAKSHTGGTMLLLVDAIRHGNDNTATGLLQDYSIEDAKELGKRRYRGKQVALIIVSDTMRTMHTAVEIAKEAQIYAPAPKVRCIENMADMVDGEGFLMHGLKPELRAVRRFDINDRILVITHGPTLDGLMEHCGMNLDLDNLEGLRFTWNTETHEMTNVTLLLFSTD